MDKSHEMKSSSSTKGKKNNAPKADWLAYGIITLVAIGVKAAGMWAADNIELGVAAQEKPYSTFESFYPFYLSQHEDTSCRRLHFVGTSLVILYSLVDFRIGLSLLPAGLLGLGLVPLLMDVPHGFFEMAAMVLAFLLCVISTTGSVKHGVICLLIGYSFAWVGHFFFELNRPATFIYPTYSLLGDFRMWFEMATGARAF